MFPVLPPPLKLIKFGSSSQEVSYPEKSTCFKPKHLEPESEDETQENIISRELARDNYLDVGGWSPKDFLEVQDFSEKAPCRIIPKYREKPIPLQKWELSSSQPKQFPTATFLKLKETHQNSLGQIQSKLQKLETLTSNFQHTSKKLSEHNRKKRFEDFPEAHRDKAVQLYKKMLEPDQLHQVLAANKCLLAEVEMSLSKT